MGVHDVPTMFCTMFGYLRDDNIRMFNLTPDNLRYTLFMTIFLSPTGIIKFSINFIIPPPAFSCQDVFMIFPYQDCRITIHVLHIENIKSEIPL